MHASPSLQHLVFFFIDLNISGGSSTMIVHLGPSILGLLDTWFTPELYPEPSLNVYMPWVGTGDISSVQRYVFLFLLFFSFVCFSMCMYMCSCMFRYMKACGCIVNVCACVWDPEDNIKCFFPLRQGLCRWRLGLTKARLLTRNSLGILLPLLLHPSPGFVKRRVLFFNCVYKYVYGGLCEHRYRYW